MSRFTGTDAANLKEAYASIYAYKPQWVINEETGGAVLILDEETGDYITAVSYTHLTLPTKA